MHWNNKKMGKNIKYSLFFFILAQLINMPVIDIDYMKTVRAITVTICFICALAIWARATIHRCGGKYLSKLLTIEYIMMLMLLIVRCIKYETNNYPFSLYLWYFSYIPIIFMPLVAFLTTTTIENGAKIEKKFALLFLPAFLLAGAVVTNSLHGLVFNFGNQAASLKNDYKHSYFYYIILVWLLFFLVATIVNGLRISRIDNSRVARRLIISLVLGTLGFVVYYATGPFVLRTYIINFYDGQCLLYVLFFEICFNYGLIPANDDHERILENASIWMRITGKKDNIIFSSKGELAVSEEQMKAAKAGDRLLINQQYELESYEIYGGHAYIASDISELVKLNEELEEAKEILLGEQEILDQENSAKSQYKKVEHQNALFEKIDDAMAGKDARVRELLSKVDSNSPDWKHYLGKVCIVSAFIKRQGNLMLLAEQGQYVSVKELALCFTETMNYINNYGITGDFFCQGEGELSVKTALQIYGWFEEVVEQVWDQAGAMLVGMKQTGDGIELSCEIASSSELELALNQSFVVSTDYDREDECFYVRAFFEKEVER